MSAELIREVSHESTHPHGSNAGRRCGSRRPRLPRLQLPPRRACRCRTGYRGSDPSRFLSAIHAEAVVHFTNTRDERGVVFAASFVLSLSDSAREHHLTVLDRDLDVARVDHWIVAQPIADILADPFVGPLISLWPSAREASDPVARSSPCSPRSTP